MRDERAGSSRVAVLADVVVQILVPTLKANQSTPSKGGSERKTGLYAPDVATVRVLCDERGWLRLAV
jgi:hypothetical protein